VSKVHVYVLCGRYNVKFTCIAGVIIATARAREVIGVMSQVAYVLKIVDDMSPKNTK